MAVKTPIRTVYTNSVATGLAEYQTNEFIALAHGGIGASLSIGSAGQVLKVNSGASALEFGGVEAVINIDGMTDGSSATLATSDKIPFSDGGTEKYMTVATLNTFLLSNTQTLTNKTLTSPVLNTGVSGSAILDEDNFASDSATKLATQQSIKAYIATQVSVGDITSVVAGTGLTGGATSGAATVNVIGGTGITANANDIAIDSTVTTLTGTQTLTNKTLTAPTITGTAVMATLDISGDVDVDGTLEADAYTVDGTALNEYIADTIGAMVGSNTESGITVAYQDGDNTLDFTVGTLNQNTTGTAAVATAVTITDNESTDENNAIIFGAGGDVDGGNLGLESDGNLTYNPSTGTLNTTNISVTGTQTIVNSVTMNASNAVIFEGATADAYETTLTTVDATADRTISLPNATDTLVGKATTDTLTNKTLTSPVLNTGVSGSAIVDEDNMSSNSATKLATQQSIKAYVDAQITAEDLDVTSDSGTIDIDLDSETLTIAGGTGLASSASSTTVTLAIDSTVATLTGSQTLTNKTLTAPTITGGTFSGTFTGTQDLTGVVLSGASPLVFEGATADNYETTLAFTDPTADRTVYMPNATGYLPLLNAASTTVITATPAELNYVDGVTSAIQTQLTAKATKAFAIAQAVALG